MNIDFGELSHVHIDAIRTALRRSVRSRLKNRALLDEPVAKLTSDEYAELHDAAMQAWRDDAPTVLTLYWVGGCFGPYALNIRGVPGAYFMQALEHDGGPFGSVAEGELWIRCMWTDVYDTFDAAKAEEEAGEAGEDNDDPDNAADESDGQ